jgi:hypothetical protein
LDDNVAVGEFMWYLLHQVEIPSNFDPNAILQQQMEPTKGAIDQLMQGYDGQIIKWFADHLADDEWIIGGIKFFQKDVETKVCAKDLLNAFQKELKLEQELLRRGKNDDLKVDFTGALTVNKLTRNFTAMFGKDCILKNVRAEYIIPRREVLQEGFRTHTLKSSVYCW